MNEHPDHPVIASPRRMLTVGYPIRMLFYTAVTALAMQLTLQVIQKDSLEHLASENGPIEVAQFAILILAAAMAGFASRVATRLGTAIFGLSAALFCAASREADDWFAMLVFDDAYKWLVCLPLFTLVALEFWKNRESIYYQCAELLSQPYGTVLAFAIVLIGTLCQTLDRTSFWPTISAAPIVGDQKSVIEETVELFGYLLILFSTTELAIHTWQQRLRASKKSLWCDTLLNSARKPNDPHRDGSVIGNEQDLMDSQSSEFRRRENVA